MANDLVMRLQMMIADKVSAPLKKIQQASGLTAKGLQATRTQLERLGQQRQLIDRLKEQQRAWQNTSNQLKIHQAQLQSLRNSGTATATQIARQTALVDKSNASLQRQSGRLVELRRAINASGIGKLSTDEQKLNQAIAQTTARLRDQEAAIHRINSIKSTRDEQLGGLAKVGGVGLAMRMAGQRGLSAAASFMLPGFDFDKTMARVQALTQLEKDSDAFKQLRQQARDLGASTNFSANDAAEGQALLAMAGFNPKEIMGAMPGMLDMSLASGVELGRTAEIASNISRGFGIDANDMTRVADVLTVALTSSNTTLETLGDTMKYVAPNAQALGVSMEETAALAGLLGNVGIQGSQAGTALRGMFIRMSTQPAAARKALEDLGISFADSSGNMRNFSEILVDVYKATENMGNMEKMKYVAEIFGREPSSAVMELLNTSNAGEMQAFIERIQNSQGAAAKTALTMNEHLGGKLKALESGWEELGNKFYDSIKEDLSDIVIWVTKVIGAINEWATANPALVETIAKVVSGALVLLTVVGTLMVTITAILAPLVMFKASMMILGVKVFGAGGAIKWLVNIIKWAGLVLKAHPLILAIGLLATAVYLIYQNWDSFVWFFNDLWDQVKTAFDGGIAGISAFILNWSPIGLFYKAFAMVLDYFGVTLPENFTTFAAHMFTNFGNSVMENGKALLVWFTTVFVSVFTWFMVDLPQKFTGFGKMMMDGLINGIKNTAGAVKDSIVNLGDNVVGWFSDKLNINSPSKVFMSVAQSIPEGVALGITKDLPVVSAAVNELNDTTLDPFASTHHSNNSHTTATTATPPLMSTNQRGGNTVHFGGDTYNITLQSGSSDNNANLMQQLERLLEQREREKAARYRSRLSD